MRQSRVEKRDRTNVFYSLEEFATAPRTADLPFLVYEAKRWTFKETYDMVLRYAAWLHHNHAVQTRDVVALDFVNCPEFIFLWLALWSLGAIPAFLNYNLTGRSLIHSVRVSTARLLIIDPEIRSALNPEVEAELTSPTFGSTSNCTDKPSQPFTIVHFSPIIQSSLPYQPPYRAPDAARSKVRPRDPAILISTSGTTGLPKPAIISWAKVRVAGCYVALWLGLRPATHQTPDRFYCCLPLYHSSGSLLGVCSCLLNGTTFILGHRFSIHRFWREVRDSDATILQYVGEMCRYLLSAPPEPDPADPNKNLDRANKIRIAFGNGLRPDVWDRFKSRFGIETVAEFYGATEGTAASWNYSSNSFAAGAVGRNGALGALLLRRQLCIVAVDYMTEMPARDPETGLCIAVPRGQPGELLFALDASDISDKFQGYFNDAAASEKKVLRSVLAKGDAWFRTGDVLRWDEEGRWWFVDRIGDTFRWKSENVSTAEVAQVLGRHPAVVEANVYGVHIPGHDGRAGCAAVLLNDDNKDKDGVMADLGLFASNSLPRYSIPLFIRLVREMPSTGTLKQQKHVLRREGVDPDKVEGECGEEVWWFRELGAVGRSGAGAGAGYIRFKREDWHDLTAGMVKL